MPATEDEPSAVQFNRHVLLIAALAAALLHLLALVLAQQLIIVAPADPADATALRVQLHSYAAVEQASPAPVQINAHSTAAAGSPPAESEALEPQAIDLPAAPEVPVANTLQQYLRGGPLPEVTIKQPAIPPTQAPSAVFSPTLREKLKRARARSQKQSRRSREERYTMPSGAQYERQGDNCFIGRDIPSPSGPLRVWYPTACRDANTAIEAIERLSQERQD